MSKEKKHALSEAEGLIPEFRFPEFEKDGEWKEKTLKDVADSESSSLALNKLEHKENGYPVYGADSIVGYIDEFQQEEKYISIVKDGSGVGRLNLCQPKSSILGTLAYIKSKDVKRFNLDWIYYLMNTIDFTFYKKGSGIPHIYYSDFKIEPIGLPKPEEQQKIASCLSSLDELIAAHNEKLDALKDQKKGLMQNLFPQEGQKVPNYRFPEFENDREWELKPLEEVAKITTGNKDTQDKIDDGKYPFFVRSQTIERISSYSFDGEAILTSGDGVGVGKIYHYIIGKFDYHQRVYCIYDFDKNIEGKFIFYYFSEHFYQRVMQLSAKNSVDSVRRAMITLMPIALPPTKKEQQKIASCLSAVDELIIAQSEKIEQLQQHKKGLMQGLFPKIEN
ncbi:MAG: restriction endonuclease subunit S [Schleiferiaceae bacterium]|jgi:type I restriction enzyme S subunit|nr:restriction endonuclease subunit S [Schleiferiaceae bacterium]